MIISVNDAEDFYPDATPEMCAGLEEMVRRVTNNNFQLPKFRVQGLTLKANQVTFSQGRADVFRVGDTIELNDTDYNDGLYVISGVSDGVLEVDGAFIPETSQNAIGTKIAYPSDVIEGVKKLLAYDHKMGDKVGIKHESVARWSVTYYDVNASESREGYPAVLLGFLDKYRKIRWS